MAVAQPDDESKTGTLPDPELNPLLNPLLAANMGRWAEVYFTNPPEKRAQAVAELLRELENNPQPEHPPAVPGDENTYQASGDKQREDTLLRRSYVNTEKSASVCEGCGHSNTSGQRFCGMCGMPLPSESGSPIPPFDEEPPREKSWHDQEVSRGEIAHESESNFYEESASGYEQRRVDFPSLTPLPDRSSYSAGDHGEDSVDGLFAYHSEPPRRNYRLYVGVGLAIILGLLVYKTWRGNAPFGGNRAAPSALPQEAPSADNQAATAEKPAAPTATPQNPKDNAATNETASAPPASEQRRPEAAAPRPSHANVGPRVPSTPAAVVNTSIAPTAQSGGVELATGERYLNGGPGTARDSHEAAAWLWKAVAKQNPTAGLLLSDLYLHGDGVSKSCDQARLLLDAAARKGNAAAAQRLRNLPAFGCQ